MAKPVIMTVDDEPQVLNAVARDLQARYGTDYRIVKAGSGKEALEAVEELERRNTPVALFVVDQRMPGMTGTEFLTEAISHFPDAKRVLLTAYADTDAAITSINAIDLDYYLLKPWDPPEERFYPVVNDLLATYPGANGVKTGSTTAAGRCLVVSAERDDRTIVAVALGAPTDEARFIAGAQLLDWGFSQP